MKKGVLLTAAAVAGLGTLVLSHEPDTCELDGDGQLHLETGAIIDPELVNIQDDGKTVVVASSTLPSASPVLTCQLAEAETDEATAPTRFVGTNIDPSVNNPEYLGQQFGSTAISELNIAVQNNDGTYTIYSGNDENYEEPLGTLSEDSGLRLAGNTDYAGYDNSGDGQPDIAFPVTDFEFNQ